MNALSPLLPTLRVVQVCLFVLAAIALFGGSLQFTLGQPDTTPRYDNLHRFLAGIYLGCGLIALWAGITIREQGTLVYLISVAVLIAGMGRVVSMSKVGIPEPHGLWIGYAASEFILPVIMIVGLWMARRGAAG
jgi:hypothetical protein